MTTTETRTSQTETERQGQQRTPARTDRGGVAQLQTERGRTLISDAVVAKIAGVACREVAGVHEMGKGVARTFGGLRERMPGGATNYAQGVHVEVGERQAAVDVDIVVEYGASIPDVAEGVRDNVMRRVEDMTGLEVVEVNISVDDVALDEELDNEEPRVQ
jgi:uncharacterized alkaline shock family protein YloU